ncbi:hypothetical protein RMS29_026570 (plasmid) [Agrobacterium rosae]|uniref:Uncharacterized protein n=1 Tax=Agrobacterium rosae TaxID=1972867 RepID=A0ABU4W271_9HYPH|nr:hypothetical protein [Agrobacterium rosae]MDX8331882.1 hypothetical protein [Agrobacterium rosae]
MKKIVPIIAMLSILLAPLTADASSELMSDLFPVRIGTYAPDGECDAAAAAMIYVEQDRLGANKASGRVNLVRRDGQDYVLDVLWIEAGSSQVDGEADMVTITVKDHQSFLFANSNTGKTLMTWCN